MVLISNSLQQINHQNIEKHFAKLFLPFLHWSNFRNVIFQNQNEKSSFLKSQKKSLILIWFYVDIYTILLDDLTSFYHSWKGHSSNRIWNCTWQIRFVISLTFNFAIHYSNKTILLMGLATQKAYSILFLWHWM